MLRNGDVEIEFEYVLTMFYTSMPILTALHGGNGVLKLFPWTKDFTPSTLKQTSAQVWIRIHGLSQEYWRPRILFTIASSIGTPICIDSASTKSVFDRPFGHYVRVLVDLDLTKDLSYKILVERVGFAFFVDIDYEKIPAFCNFCKCIGHSLDNCKRKDLTLGKDKENIQRQEKHIYIPTGKKLSTGENSKSNPESQVAMGDNGARPAPISTPIIDCNTEVPPDSSNDRNEDCNTDPILVPVLSGATHRLSADREESSDGEFVDATQMVNFVPETQLDERFKNQVTNFLHESWNNMADLDDPGVDLFQQ
ncbi:uncharacterized protein LOC131629071 [Vicia villosa]|uniref:uncharacterized protein LOC131629071 n=1 Tax=Vicia villosa TaxID=3911 RepID=UPI00273BFA97|nr:uncharacterized protein LOC131629071 [Vicia villosa]